MDYGQYRIKSVEKALRALKMFSGRRTVINLSELSNELGVHKSTAYRIASTLCEEGFLRWDPVKGSYSLGLSILELGATLIHNMELRTQARPYLEKLRTDLAETVHLGVLYEGNVVYLDKIEGDRAIRLYSEVGKRVPCHCTALGKVLIADLPEDEIDKIIKKSGMQRFTPNTIVTLPDLNTHLKAVREQGYAVDKEEHELMVYCVAAPVRDHTGRTVAAISATAILRDYVDGELDHTIEAIQMAAGNISIEMGCLDNK